MSYKIYVRVFISSKECGLWRYNQIKIRSYWIKMGPKTHNWCPHKKAMWRHRDTETYREKTTMWRWRRRLEWITYKLRNTIMAVNYHKLERDIEGFFSGTFRRSRALPTLWFWTLASRTVRINLFCFNMKFAMICYGSPRKWIHTSYKGIPMYVCAFLCQVSFAHIVAVKFIRAVCSFFFIAV